MDSLVASYGSSDEDEPQQQQPVHRHERSSSSSTSLAPSRSSSNPLFSALPRPKSSSSSSSSSPSPSFFSSSLPPPKSQASRPNPKRIIQIKPPPLPTYPDEDDDEPVRPRKSGIPTPVNSSSVKSFLSSIPLPKSSSALGALPSSSSSGRRSILETSSAPVDDNASHPAPSAVIVPPQNVEYEAAATFDSGYADYSNYQSYDSGSSYGVEVDQTVVEGGYAATAAAYGNHWGDEVGGSGAGRSSRGKRGRNEIPPEVETIEVSQDELTKNRPREDQVKSTGIAFGPAYQPISSGKGKPTKLHKRKHQIGTLYFDMKQKEMELQERRAKGFLTKAQTHAKYGW